MCGSNKSLHTIFFLIKVRLNAATLFLFIFTLIEQKYNAYTQCSGSMTFWGGSGGSMLLTNGSGSDPDPAIFVTDLQDASKKLIFNTFCLLLFEGTFT